MRTYKATKMGYNYSITSKGKQLMLPRTFKLTQDLVEYARYYAECKRMTEAEVFRAALQFFFEHNDALLIKEYGFADYELYPNKSFEYIQLFESPNKK